MIQDQIMQQSEDQWLDDLNDAHWEQELKELHEQEEEEMYMQWQAATYANWNHYHSRSDRDDRTICYSNSLSASQSSQFKLLQEEQVSLSFINYLKAKYQQAKRITKQYFKAKEYKGDD